MKKIIQCISLIIFGLCLNGCEKSNSNIAKGAEYSNNNQVTEEIKVEENESSNEKQSIKESIEEESAVSQNKTVTTQKKDIIIEKNEQYNQESIVQYNSDKDNSVIEKFNSMNEKIKESLNNETVNSAKDKAKGYFITVVDFIFYDSEINGVKFNDLTEKGKETVLNIVSSTDSLIMKKFPTYKEEISQSTSSAYKKASEIIKNGANNIKNFARESLGDEYYSSISGATSDLVYYSKKAVGIVGDFSGSVWTKSKETIKSWYENLKKGV